MIDACIEGAKLAGTHSQSSESPILLIFFRKLCGFLNAPVTLVFVFDGPHRPSTKRGKKVINRPLWITDYAKALIEAFGFYWHIVRMIHCYFPEHCFSCVARVQAPGEAEAELATLNSLHWIDAIITTDSDTIIFGANCILRGCEHSPLS